MIMKRPTSERLPLATPFELAQIAVAMASMREKSLPDAEDLDAAVRFLRQAALRIQDEKRPRVFYAQSVMADSLEEAEAMKAHPNQVPMSPKSHPKEWAEMVSVSKKAVRGWEKIDVPKRYSTASFWRAVLGGHPSRKDIEIATDRVARNAPQIAGYLKQISPRNESEFWHWASFVVPHLPRFSAYYAQSKKKPRRSNGKFTKPAKDQKGKFKKMADS